MPLNQENQAWDRDKKSSFTKIDFKKNRQKVPVKCRNANCTALFLLLVHTINSQFIMWVNLDISKRLFTLLLYFFSFSILISINNCTIFFLYFFLSCFICVMFNSRTYTKKINKKQKQQQPKLKKTKKDFFC